MYSYLVKQLIKLEEYGGLNQDEFEELIHMLKEKADELQESLDAQE